MQVKEEDDGVVVIDDSSDEEQAERVAPDNATNNNDTGNQGEMIWTSPYDAIPKEDIIGFPLPQAQKMAFPPACRVRIMPQQQKGDDNNTRYVHGVVTAVSMQFSTHEDLYKIHYENSDVKSYWKAEDLEFAPRCPVWLHPNPKNLQERTAAVVLGTEYYPADPEEELEATVLHSLQIVQGPLPHMIHHGVPREQLKYRSPLDPLGSGKQVKLEPNPTVSATTSATGTNVQNYDNNVKAEH